MLGFKLVYVSKRGTSGFSPVLVVTSDCGVEVSYFIREVKISDSDIFRWDEKCDDG